MITRLRPSAAETRKGGWHPGWLLVPLQCLKGSTQLHLLVYVQLLRVGR